MDSNVLLLQRNYSNNNFKILHIVLSGFLLVICCFFDDYILNDYIAMAIFAQFYIIVLISDSNLVWKYVFLHYYIVTATVSVFICDTSKVYLNELDQYSFFAGALPLQLLYYYMVMVFLVILENTVYKNAYLEKNKVRYDGFDRIGLAFFKYACILLFILGAFFFAMVATKPAFLLGVDRFAYAMNYLPSFLNRIHLLPNVVSPVIVIALIKRDDYSFKKKIVLFFAAMLPYMIFEIWTGQRFQVFFMLVWSLAPLILISFKKDNMLLIKQFKLLFVIAIVLFGIVSLFALQRNISLWGFLKQRLCQQGQLWWKLYSEEKINNFALRLKEFPVEVNAIVRSILNRGTSKDYGIYRIMYLTTPVEIVSNKLKTGSRYAAQGLELPFYYFKYVGLLVASFIEAVLFSFLSNKYYISIYKARIIESLIYLKILQKALTAFCQGDWHSMLSPVSFLCYFILMLFAVVRIFMLYNEVTIRRNAEEL